MATATCAVNVEVHKSAASVNQHFLHQFQMTLIFANIRENS